jgi:hypothetical protein
MKICEIISWFKNTVNKILAYISIWAYPHHRIGQPSEANILTKEKWGKKERRRYRDLHAEKSTTWSDGHIKIHQVLGLKLHNHLIVPQGLTKIKMTSSIVNESISCKAIIYLKLFRTQPAKRTNTVCIHAQWRRMLQEFDIQTI